MKYSKIYWGHVFHQRTAPQAHSFSYPIFLFALDLAELNSLDSVSKLLRHNRFGVFQIRDQDYLSNTPTEVNQKLDSILTSNGFSSKPARTLVITMPRFFGYVFNPVSFYLSTFADGSVHSFIAEVSNTFAERHLYVLSNKSEPDAKLPQTYRFPKEFYVSPFFRIEGNYELTVSSADNELKIDVNLENNGEQIFFSGIRAHAKEFNAQNLWATIFRYPHTIFMTMTRIHIQALRLRLKQIIPFQKPPPPHAATQSLGPTWVHRVRLFLLSLLGPKPMSKISRNP